MTPAARTRRRHPARVYWFRRTVVLALALGLVFGIAQLLGRGSLGETDRASTVGGAPEAAASPASPASTGDAGSASPTAAEPTQAGVEQAKSTKKKKKTKPAPLPEPTGPCDPAEIVATPQIVGDAWAAHDVTIRVELTTQETPACNWTASPSSLVVKLTSGKDRIWSSQDCPAAVPTAAVVVRKKAPATVDVTWRGQRSDDICSRTTSWAEPGWYHVEASAYGAEAEPTDLQFQLTKAVAPTRTADPKPRKKRAAQD